MDYWLISIPSILKIPNWTPSFHQFGFFNEIELCIIDLSDVETNKRSADAIITNRLWPHYNSIGEGG